MVGSEYGGVFTPPTTTPSLNPPLLKKLDSPYEAMNCYLL